MTLKQRKINWCKIPHEQDRNSKCCRCGIVGYALISEGDGKIVHTICSECVKRWYIE